MELYFCCSAELRVRYGNVGCMILVGKLFRNKSIVDLCDKFSYIFSLEIFCYLRSVVVFTQDLRDVWRFLRDVHDQNNEYLT